MSVATPPRFSRGQSTPSVDTNGRIGRNVHAAVHAFSTPRCVQQKPQFSEAFTTLSTVSTPYIYNYYIEGKLGALGRFQSRLPISTRGVDTSSVDSRS